MRSSVLRWALVWLSGAVLVAWSPLAGAAPIATDVDSADERMSSLIQHEAPVELAWPDLGPADPVTTPGTLTEDVEALGHRFAALEDLVDITLPISPGAAGAAGPVAAGPTQQSERALTGSASAGRDVGRHAWMDWAGLALAVVVLAAMALGVLRSSTRPRTG